MTPQTYQLHLMLVRMAKGAITAWEKWIRATGTEDSQELPKFTGDPDLDSAEFRRASRPDQCPDSVMRRR